MCYMKHVCMSAGSFLCMFHTRCNIMLVPEIPSRYRSGRDYRVAIMYVPTSRPQRFGDWWNRHMGYRCVIFSY